MGDLAHVCSTTRSSTKNYNMDHQARYRNVGRAEETFVSDFEKLGAFYLGRGYDLRSQAPGEDPLLYDAKDLATHGLIVGMTGSGKTGLSVVLLEEAAIDGIPAIVIDPKGDMANLLLIFPKLRPADVRSRDRPAPMPATL